MTFNLGFDVERDYSAYDTLRLVVTLHHGSDRVRFDADIDTGSTFCIFDRGHAESLGLDVESGGPARFATVTGSFNAFGHIVTLETLGFSFDVTVYFAATAGFSRNVLGRRGWLDQVRLGIVEYENKMYVSRYGD